VRYVRGEISICRKLLEIRAPFLRNGIGIVQIELIELFDIGGIPT
jgi:hypothetical protein